MRRPWYLVFAVILVLAWSPYASATDASTPPDILFKVQGHHDAGVHEICSLSAEKVYKRGVLFQHLSCEQFACVLLALSEKSLREHGPATFLMPFVRLYYDPCGILLPTVCANS